MVTKLLSDGQPRKYAVMGPLVALGAPVGLAVLRLLLRGSASAHELFADVERDPWTYGYVAIATMTAFGVFGWFQDRQARLLYEMAIIDALTQLCNRRAFEEQMTLALARRKRDGSSLSLALFDVDGLKTINDRDGHRCGDSVLKAVAQALRDGSREADLVARWGGDEFAILAPDTDHSEALQLAERIRTLVASSGAGVTVSAGVATTAPGTDRGGDLLRIADAALYVAKARGRNCVESSATS